MSLHTCVCVCVCVCVFVSETEIHGRSLEGQPPPEKLNKTKYLLGSAKSRFEGLGPFVSPVLAHAAYIIVLRARLRIR